MDDLAVEDDASCDFTVLLPSENDWKKAEYDGDLAMPAPHRVPLEDGTCT